MAQIPSERCIAGRDLTEPRLSPDGTMLVYASSSAGAAALVLDRLDGSPERHLTTYPAPRPGRGLGGGCFCWMPDSSAVVYAGADGNLWLQPVPGGSVRALTDHGPERAAQAPMVAPDGSRVVYVVDQAEIWESALGTSSSRRLDDGSADFCFDPWVMPCSTGAVWQAWNVPDMPWDSARVARASFDGTVGDDHTVDGAVQQPRMLPDGRDICVSDQRGWSNVWIGNDPVVDEPFEHAGPTWGLGQRSYTWSPDGGSVAFTRNEAGFGRLCVVDLATREVRAVARGVHGQLSWHGTQLCAVRTGARTPTQIVIYDTETWARRVVAVGPVSGWEDEALVEPDLIEVPTTDGAVVHARLYRADHEPDTAPRMLCWVHGGPTDQWPVTFQPRIAFWRSRGWSVLVPDHRGSTGHGRDYQQAMHGRWGELDVADTAAAISAAQRDGVATPSTTALIGGSAGGFTVLGVAARHHDLAAAAVVSYPVTDLVGLAERSHRFERHYTLSLVGPLPPLRPEGGHVVDAPGPYRDRSPVWFADRISTPLLVFHGDVDPVVPVDQSRVLVERMRAAGGDVELYVYAGEGHGFRQPANQLDEYERIEQFLDRHVPRPRS